jgi:murein DD-endopeptidase MepM/ murein hydrolase activator NlpD
MKKAVICIFAIILLAGISYAGTVITIIPATPKVGGTFVAIIEGAKPLQNVTGSFEGINMPFYPLGAKFRAIVPVPLNVKPGKRILHIEAQEKGGGNIVIDRYVAVKRTIFQKLSFWLPADKLELLTRETIDEGWAKIEEIITKGRNAQLWRGKFIRPVYGRITMQYGAVQVINGERRGQHRGVDTSGKPWTKIWACNSGQVVFAQTLKAYGNVVVIDHGQGVFSLYLHLIKIAVKTDEMVWAGKVIGYMGSTGVASGTHLHWGLSVNNVRVDPMEWVGRAVAE